MFNHDKDKMNIVSLLLYGFVVTLSNQHLQKEPEKQVRKNGMTVHWKYQNDRIVFSMSAPTTGWMAIGFNQSDNLTGSYFLMGRIEGDQGAVIEYHTYAPGDYRPIFTDQNKSQVQVLSCKEFEKSSTITFSLPIHQNHDLGQDLTQNKHLVMHIAFSRSKDFSHHSMMRTSLSVKL